MLGGDTWNARRNPRLEKGTTGETWLSGLNYCKWGTEISGANGGYNQLVCDEFGNVLNLNMREWSEIYSPWPLSRLQQRAPLTIFFLFPRHQHNRTT